MSKEKDIKFPNNLNNVKNNLEVPIQVNSVKDNNSSVVAQIFNNYSLNIDLESVPVEDEFEVFGNNFRDEFVFIYKWRPLWRIFRSVVGDPDKIIKECALIFRKVWEQKFDAILTYKSMMRFGIRIKMSISFSYYLMWLNNNNKFSFLETVEYFRLRYDKEMRNFAGFGVCDDFDRLKGEIQNDGINAFGYRIFKRFGISKDVSYVPFYKMEETRVRFVKIIYQSFSTTFLRAFEFIFIVDKDFVNKDKLIIISQLELYYENKLERLIGPDMETDSLNFEKLIIGRTFPEELIMDILSFYIAYDDKCYELPGEMLPYKDWRDLPQGRYKNFIQNREGLIVNSAIIPEENMRYGSKGSVRITPTDEMNLFPSCLEKCVFCNNSRAYHNNIKKCVAFMKNEKFQVCRMQDKHSITCENKENILHVGILDGEEEELRKAMIVQLDDLNNSLEQCKNFQIDYKISPSSKTISSISLSLGIISSSFSNSSLVKSLTKFIIKGELLMTSSVFFLIDFSLNKIFFSLDP
jgi:hypothetical protein